MLLLVCALAFAAGRMSCSDLRPGVQAPEALVEPVTDVPTPLSLGTDTIAYLGIDHHWSRLIA